MKLPSIPKLTLLQEKVGDRCAHVRQERKGLKFQGHWAQDFEDSEILTTIFFLIMCDFQVLHFGASKWSHIIPKPGFGGFMCYPKATVSPKPSPEVIVNIHQFSVKFFKILRLKSSSSPLEVTIPVVGLVQKGHLWYLRKLMFTKATVSLKPSPLTMVPNIEKYYHDPFDLYDPLDWCSEPEVVSPSKSPKDPKIEGILSLDTKGIHS